MNFKTTVVLLVLLVIAFGALFFVREKEGDGGGEVEESRQKLFDVAATDVNKLIVSAADGKRMALEKAAENKWRMTEPVNAPAESFEVDSLVRAVTELESRGKVTGSTANAEATGLAKPSYVVELSTTAGKSYTLNVGTKAAVGDIVYVSRKDQGGTLVVSGDLVEKLEKPAVDYRDKKLVDVSTGDVRQIALAKSDGSKLIVSRTGNGADWKITEPRAMPAEKSEVDDILFALTGLRATEFVAEDAAKDPSAAFTPRITATISTTQPTTHTFVSTAPTTAATQPAPLVIRIGPADLLNKNVPVMTSASPIVARVGATILETLNKTPLELRDKRAMDVDPAQVSSIRITSDLAATTRPTTREASKMETVIQRRKETAAPATAPAVTSTQPAKTQASSQPATTQATAATQPATKWEVMADGAAKPADDSKVDSLLSQLHPLRAQKYLESASTTQPTATYVVRITTVAAGGDGATHELKLVDPGDSKPLIATYNDLAFEADRSIVDRLSGDFLQGSAATPSAGDDDFDAAPFSPGP